MSRLQERVKMLEPLGVEVHHDYRYVGEGKERHREELPDTVTSVLLPLTPEEWCRIAMREGDMYIGGCCGTASAMQDQINMAFRDGGWIDNGAFCLLGEYARSHEGFDEFDPNMEDGRFAELAASWKKQADEGIPEGYVSDLWLKIGIVYSAVEPALRPDVWDAPKKEQDPLVTLERDLARLNWLSLFEDHPAIEKTGHVRGMLIKARMLDPLRRVLAQLEAEDQVFEGVALVESGSNEVLVNRLGSCIYVDEADARHWLELMERTSLEDTQDWMKGLRAEIVPVRVTVAEGLEMMR